MTKIFILSLLLLCSIYYVSAMRPAPFEKEYSYTDPSSGIRLVSTNNGDDGYSTEGAVSTIFDADGNILYEMPIFTGRRSIYLSPDGSVVVLDGEFYWGDGLMRVGGEYNEDTVITSIYNKGEMWGEVKYERDLDGDPPDPRYVLGGGWADRSFTLSADWDRNVLHYEFENKDDVDIPLPLEHPPVDKSIDIKMK